MTSPTDRAAEAPRILGVEMVPAGTKSWALDFASFSVRLDWHRGEIYNGIAFGGVAAWRKPLPDCIAAIERELLAIRDSIPVPARGARWKDGDGPVKCFTCEAMVPEPSVCDACYARAAEPPQPASVDGVDELPKCPHGCVYCQLCGFYPKPAESPHPSNEELPESAWQKFVSVAEGDLRNRNDWVSKQLYFAGWHDRGLSKDTKNKRSVKKE